MHHYFELYSEENKQMTTKSSRMTPWTLVPTISSPAQSTLTATPGAEHRRGCVTLSLLNRGWQIDLSQKLYLFILNSLNENKEPDDPILS